MNPRLWHPTSKFPIPGVKLLVRTETGEEIEAIRLTYAKSYKDNLDFRWLENTSIVIKGVQEWSIL